MLELEWSSYQSNEDTGNISGPQNLIPKHKVVEAIPLLGLEAAKDAKLLPLLGNSFPSCEWDKKACFSALLICLWRNLTSGFPFLGVAGDVLDNNQRAPE